MQLFASDAKVCSGTNIVFNCSADGNPQAHTYQLYENDIAVNNVTSLGVWSRTMSVGGVFNYRCVASNIIGTASSPSVNITANGKNICFTVNTSKVFLQRVILFFSSVCRKIFP